MFSCRWCCGCLLKVSVCRLEIGLITAFALRLFIRGLSSWYHREQGVGRTRPWEGYPSNFFDKWHSPVSASAMSLRGNNDHLAVSMAIFRLVFSIDRKRALHQCFSHCNANVSTEISASSPRRRYVSDRSISWRSDAIEPSAHWLGSVKMAAWWDVVSSCRVNVSPPRFAERGGILASPKATSGELRPRLFP